jgi:hypothetical protein
MTRGRFLTRWIAGSAFATLFGLGFGGFIGLLGLHEGGLVTAVPAALMLSGAVAFSVGLIQGSLLAVRFAELSPIRWAVNTGLGALAAWALIAYQVGLLTAPDSDTRAWTTVMPTAAGIGLVVGTVVATAQWFELRRHADHAVWSIPLLAVAWTIGSGAFFTANGLMSEVGSEGTAVARAAGVLLLTGAIVAAVQGIGLVRILDV